MARQTQAQKIETLEAKIDELSRITTQLTAAVSELVRNPCRNTQENAAKERDPSAEPRRVGAPSWVIYRNYRYGKIDIKCFPSNARLSTVMKFKDTCTKNAPDGFQAKAFKSLNNARAYRDQAIEADRMGAFADQMEAELEPQEPRIGPQDTLPLDDDIPF